MSDRVYCRICEAACGLLVQKDEQGTPHRLIPDRKHPVSQGFVCAKGTRFLEVARHPERLLSPMIRQEDGSLQKASWKEALMEISNRIKPILTQFGPHSVGVYFGNPLAFNALGTMSLIGFLKTLKTRNVYSAGSQDCNNKFAGAQIVHGSPTIHPIPDFENTDLAVLFGTNPAISQSSFIHLEGGSEVFSRLIKRGGNVVWVDPRRTESAKRWGTHLAIRPGRDIFLLLSLLHMLHNGTAQDPNIEGLEQLLTLAALFPVERASQLTGISKEEIEALALKIQQSSRTSFHMSVGVNQGPFGTLSYITLQALSYITGNMDQTGGVLFHPAAIALGKLFKLFHIGTEPRRSRIGNFQSVLDNLPGGILADEILEPGTEKIRALLVVSGNPLQSIPGGEKLRKAFQKLECLVSIDLFENETGKVSDILLPATSWLERWDVATTTIPFQKSSLMQMASPILSPQGEARMETRIFGDILAALGKRNWLWAFGKIPWSRILPKFGYGLSIPSPKAGSYLGKGPLTPGHRVRFWQKSLEPEIERLQNIAQKEDSEDFTLIGRRRRLAHNSWLHGGLRDGNPEAFCWLHPADLTDLGIAEGEMVEIRSKTGKITLFAKCKEDLARKTVVVPHGLWEANINSIIPSGKSAIERLSGQHLMTGISVKILPKNDQKCSSTKRASHGLSG